MLAPLMSRCMTPLPCMKSNACANSYAIRHCNGLRSEIHWRDPESNRTRHKVTVTPAPLPCYTARIAAFDQVTITEECHTQPAFQVLTAASNWAFGKT